MIVKTNNIFTVSTRPYIIVEKGEPLVNQQHLDELNQGIRKYQDFLNDGEFNSQKKNCNLKKKEENIMLTIIYTHKEN